VAITLLEEGLEQATNSVLLVNGIAETLLGLQSLFQVFTGGNRFRVLVNQLEGEVTNNPHQGGEVLGVIFGITVVAASTGLDLNVLSQIDDK
jgi:hypothetical protein